MRGYARRGANERGSRARGGVQTCREMSHVPSYRDEHPGGRQGRPQRPLRRRLALALSLARCGGGDAVQQGKRGGVVEREQRRGPA